MIARYIIQPDDRNHLVITKTEKSVLSIIDTRITTLEFAELLEGRCDFVKYGVYSEEAKEEYRKIAKLFKDGKIDKVIIESYVGVEPEFRIEAKPSEIKIEVIRLTRYIYVKDKVIVINPLYGISIRRWHSGYEW